jgi:predicted SprT family Zn-dependent metalloprotease
MRRSPRSPTPQTYDALQTAYDHFNVSLFGGDLPQCLITLQRQRGAFGYFSGDRFHAKAAQPGKDEPGKDEPAERKTADGIAMNPNHIGARTDQQTLSTLAHEMAHLWQHHLGKPGRRGYHNAEWAAKMRSIGLTPTDTGQAGGKQTGEKVTHIIDAGGAFEKARKALLAKGLVLTWHDPHANGAAAKKKSNTRAKYTCDACALNAWAKPGAAPVCGACEAPMSET